MNSTFIKYLVKSLNLNLRIYCRATIVKSNRMFVCRRTIKNDFYMRQLVKVIYIRWYIMCKYHYILTYPHPELDVPTSDIIKLFAINEDEVILHKIPNYIYELESTTLLLKKGLKRINRHSWVLKELKCVSTLDKPDCVVDVKKITVTNGCDILFNNKIFIIEMSGKNLSMAKNIYDSFIHNINYINFE